MTNFKVASKIVNNVNLNAIFKIYIFLLTKKKKLTVNRSLILICLPSDTGFAAKTTGLNENLIKRFRVILIALNSSEQIDVKKFELYATETANLYKSLYNWYYMPASVHKVLFHGANIIEYFDLPIGNFSEEAQEKRNKDFRNIRENNSRKNSRTNSNEDILHWLLIYSDPVISKHRKLVHKKQSVFEPEVIQLFKTDV